MNETFLITLLRMFATPLGDILNKTIATTAAGFVGWMVAKGVDATSASVIAGGLVAAASAALSALANMQGIQIKRINLADNGVKVVPASSPSPAVNGPLA